MSIKGSLGWEEMGNGSRSSGVKGLMCFTKEPGFDRCTEKLADSLRDARCRVWLRGST